MGRGQDKSSLFPEKRRPVNRLRRLYGLLDPERALEVGKQAVFGKGTRQEGTT